VRVAQLSGARLAWLRGTGHLANMRDPVRFNPLLLDVVGRVAA
jgi:hypothetical protein